MNVVLIVLVVGSVVAGLCNGRVDALSGAMVTSARGAVELSLALVGGMSLWLGLLAVVERAGLMTVIAKALTPIMRRLFPAIPAGHPAQAAMIMNLAANVLGMDNAATAFGLKAMRALDTLNTRRGTATNAMVLFLAINTAGIQALPINVIAARAAIRPETAGAIVLPTIIVTVLSMLSALVWVSLWQRLPWFRRSAPPAAAGATVPEHEATREGMREATGAQATVGAAASPAASLAARAAAWLLAIALLGALGYRLFIEAQVAPSAGIAVQHASGWLLAILAAAMLVYGLGKGVPLYDAAVTGAREGFEVCVRIMPYLVVILVGVGLFRASGLMELLVSGLGPVAGFIGMPPEVLPQALVRPLSGSGAMGLLVDTLKTQGPDSPAGFTASVIYGSSETTFYVLAVYFGAVSVRSMRHALLSCLCADLSGVLLAVWIAKWFY